jgi:hypothetical protein
MKPENGMKKKDIFNLLILTKTATDFRSWLQEIQQSIDNQTNLPDISRAKKEFEALLGEIKAEVGLSGDQQTEKLKIKLTIPFVSLELPTSVHLGFHKWMDRFLHRHPHLVF